MTDQTDTGATSGRAQWTEGERQVAVAFAVLSLIGAGLSFLIAVRIGGRDFFARGVGAYDLWMVLAGATGAALSLWQVRGRFGHPGLHGLRRALGGMAIITLAAPIIGGTLALPLYGTMFGPFALAVTFAGAPFTAVIWAAGLCGVHALFFTHRAERETIFRPRR